MNNITREEMIGSLTRKKSWIDELDVFMLGLDAPLDREIMRYILVNQNCVDNHLLVINFVYKKGLCTSINLSRRLDVLVKFNFLKRTVYRCVVLYEVVKEKEDKI